MSQRLISATECQPPARARLGAAVVLATGLSVACAGEGEELLYLNLFEVGEDPFSGVDRLEASLEDGTKGWSLNDFSHRGEFGPLEDCSPCRIQVTGFGGQQRIAWGFSPPLELGSGPLKTTLFFSRDTMAVAYAGPPLVDPEEGLVAARIPLSLRSAAAKVTLAYNMYYLYFELDLEDEVVVPNSNEWWLGDVVTLAIDGKGDSPQSTYQPDDVSLALGQSKYAEIWYPYSAQAPIVHNFQVRAGGYTVFVAIPMGSVKDNLWPGPDRVMKLGLEVRDDDGDTIQVTRWPPDWEPNPLQEVPPNCFANGAGGLALKTRLLDAQKVGSNTVNFDGGIGDFLGSGAVELTQVRSMVEDRVRVYALWDNLALFLALASNDLVFCTQRRDAGDRDQILRDDAVELVLVRHDGSSHRALFNLTGSTAYDRIDGGSWAPEEIYFRFDLSGPLPSNDCQTGDGYTFILRIPWSELGYIDQPPNLGELFAFDLVVYDNDRGAHSVSAFSPMGPSTDPQALGGLRLFEY